MPKPTQSSSPAGKMALARESDESRQKRLPVVSSLSPRVELTEQSYVTFKNNPLLFPQVVFAPRLESIMPVSLVVISIIERNNVQRNKNSQNPNIGLIITLGGKVPRLGLGHRIGAQRAGFGLGAKKSTESETLEKRTFH